MTLFLCLAAALFVIAVGTLLRPLSRGGDAIGREVDALREQLRQITGLHAAGALTDEQFASSRSAVERRLVDSLLPAGGGQAGTPRTRGSAPLAAGVASFMLAVAAGGYWLVGSPHAIGIEPGSSAGPLAAGGSGGGAADASPHALTQERLAAMVDELADRLRTRPDDADGWAMLARSEVALGRHAQALQAFANAERLRPQDAQLLADHADALAMTHQRDLEGEPSALIERALKIDPHNAKALALAGTAAFDRKDYAQAVRDWETLAKTEPPDGPFADQVGASIAEARRLGGLPEAAASGPAKAVASAGTVAGTITLAPALAAQVSPDDTLFVFARAVDGPRMPLAILRRQARDLPLDFTLDDSMAMSPAARLSGAARVVVGARISRSGNAMAQDGDLEGQGPSVAVGATGIRVEIGERVAK
jgi:cytochrome c-type biogenesis protein CcmH